MMSDLVMLMIDDDLCDGHTMGYDGRGTTLFNTPNVPYFALAIAME